MSYCRLTLYNIKGDFTSNKNFRFSNPSTNAIAIEEFLLSSYINESDTLIINNFQYLKHSTSMEIKINMSQDNYSASKGMNKKYNYIRIEWINAISGVYQEYDKAYYFIDKFEWTSQGTLKLYLSLDVINSINIKYGNKTHIVREHKNRFNSLTYNAVLNSFIANIKVDKINEGINPALFRYEKEVCEDINILDSSLRWYLIYRNTENIAPSEVNQINPVQCFLSRNKPFNIKIKETTEINTSDAGASYLTFALQNNGNHPFTIQILDGTYVGRIISPRSNLWISMYNGGIQTIDSALNVVLYPCSKISINTNEERIYYYASVHAPSTPPTSQTGYYSTSSYSSVVGMTIDSFDKTDSKLIKIIELPYCPTNYTLDNNGYQFNGFTYDNINHYLILDNLDFKFNRELTLSLNNPMDEIANRFYPSNVKNALIEYNAFDSKLYSSEFYIHKLIYDSFSFEYNMEDIDFSNYEYDELTPSLKLNYVVSSAITSKLMFQDTNTEANLIYANEDYPFTLISQRNNEIVLYTNQYVNYIRNGYNYDMKAKNIQTKYALIQSAPQMIAGAGAFLTGNVLGYGLLSSSASNAIEIIKARETAQNSINKKIQESRAQATSVEGSDDLDLLNQYNGNRLISMIYRPLEETIQALSGLFYLYGYKADRYITNNLLFNSNKRRLFNYIECDELDIDYDASDFNSDEIEELIQNRHKAGLYYIWMYGTNTCNIDFKYENIELEV